MAMETIPFLVSVPEEEDQDVKAIQLPNGNEAIIENIPVDKLKENISKICEGLSTALSDIKKVGDFKLKEVTIAVEVTAQGGVNFV